jgi:hypothetical protein
MHFLEAFAFGKLSQPRARVFVIPSISSQSRNPRTLSALRRHVAFLLKCSA